VEVRVNGKAVQVRVGMQVKDALIRAGEMEKIAAGLRVYDQWGNELGLDGALVDGVKIFVR
jgi:hypothetical protein